jgi:hypothetical protein
MTDWQREDNLLYTLEHDGWAKGVEQFRNRLMVRFEKGKDVPQEEIEKAMALFLAAPELLAALKDYMSQFGQALDHYGIPYGQAQRNADANARAAIATAEQPQLDSPQGE